MYKELRNKLKDMTEIELIEKFRNTDDENLKSLIFKIFLFEKRSKGKTWNDNIQIHIQNNLFRLTTSFYDTNHLDEQDLYQEILKSFHLMIKKWYDTNSTTSFNTYAWYTINAAVNRVFQKSRTKKRNIEDFDSKPIKLNHVCSENSKYVDIISTSQFGILKVDKNIVDSTEHIFFCKDLLEYLLNGFNEEEVIENTDIVEEMTEIIENRKMKQEQIVEMADKYDVDISEVVRLKRKITNNLEKRMFKDIVQLMKLNVRDDGIIASRYNCSRGQITKMKQKLTEACKRKLKADDLTIQDCFREEYL